MTWLPGGCPVEALLVPSLGAVSSVPVISYVISQSCPSWTPGWVQGEGLRAKTDAKWRQGRQASPVFS
jgi:hypothetical protein